MPGIEKQLQDVDVQPVRPKDQTNDLALLNGGEQAETAIVLWGGSVIARLRRLNVVEAKSVPRLQLAGKVHFRRDRRDGLRLGAEANAVECNQEC